MTAMPSTPVYTNIRRILEQQRAALLAALHHDVRETCAETVQLGDEHDPMDVSAVTAQTDIRVSLMNSRTRTLAAIDAALMRLREGRYGRCESCGEPIADARLRVVPFALRCTRCEDAKETADRVERGRGMLARRLADQRHASLSTPVNVHAEPPQ
jgi:RNA polymerase-binding transcription factor DksA